MAGATDVGRSGQHVAIVRADISILLSFILQFKRKKAVPMLYSLWKMKLSSILSVVVPCNIYVRLNCIASISR